MLKSLESPGPIASALNLSLNSNISFKLSICKDTFSVCSTGYVITSVSFSSKTLFNPRGHTRVTIPAPDFKAPIHVIEAAPVKPAEPAITSKLPTLYLYVQGSFTGIVPATH